MNVQAALPDHAPVYPVRDQPLSADGLQHPARDRAPPTQLDRHLSPLDRALVLDLDPVILVAFAGQGRGCGGQTQQ